MMALQSSTEPVRRVRIRWLIRVIIIGMLLLLAGQLQARQSNSNFAGLVVSFGEGRTETACIDLGADGTATGSEVLDASGLTIQTARSTSGTQAVCRIEDAGCEQPGTTCFCQCRAGSSCTYWAYFHLKSGNWTYDNSSPEDYTVRAGNVEGWSWGAGVRRQSGTEPPVYTFAEICADQVGEPGSAPAETTPEAAMLTCTPNSTTLIEGNGPPHTSLLLSFAGRTVGGGTSNAAGNYRLPLALGNERPDDYPVQVTTRHSGRLVRQLMCRVPEASFSTRP